MSPERESNEPLLPDLSIDDPDRLPTPERQELEAHLESATTAFGGRAERLLDQVITDREGAEATLDTVDSWLDRIATVEENPELSGLGDLELFARPTKRRQGRQLSVPSVAVIRQWMIRGDNFERLMEFRETLDRDRFDLPERDRPAR